MLQQHCKKSHFQCKKKKSEKDWGKCVKAQISGRNILDAIKVNCLSTVYLASTLCYTSQYIPHQCCTVRKQRQREKKETTESTSNNP